MILKRPLDLHRLRSRPPRGFGWLDHRLLREGYFARCSPAAMALYTLLVCAGDGRGLSFYSEPRLQQVLGLELPLLRDARRHLQALGLIAYREPLYQVLALEQAPPLPAKAPPARSPASKPRVEPSPPPAATQAAPGLDLRAMVEGALEAAIKRARR